MRAKISKDRNTVYVRTETDGRVGVVSERTSLTKYLKDSGDLVIVYHDVDGHQEFPDIMSLLSARYKHIHYKSAIKLSKYLQGVEYR